MGEKRKKRITAEDHTLVTPVSPATRAGVPSVTPAADTNPIIVTHDGVRGIAYLQGGKARTGNIVSGIIDDGCPLAKKLP